MSEKEPLLIDITFPFCAGHCVFCDEKSYGENIMIATRYRSSLEKEVAAAAEDLSSYSIRAVHIHGGALSILGYGSLENFIDILKERIPSDADTEWVIDLMPGELDEMNFSIMRLRGINTVCCGIMGMTGQELRALHRPYSINLVESSLTAIKEKSAFKFSAELVIGIPGQTPDDVSQHITRLTEAGPSEIRLTRFHDRTTDAAAQRTYAENTDWFSFIRSAEAILKEKGYGRIGTELVWARPGQALTESTPEAKKYAVMGFGIGAKTCMEGIRYHNTYDMQLYREHSDSPEDIAVIDGTA